MGGSSKKIVTSRHMALKLYRRMAADGREKMDPVEVSRRWSDRWMEYARRGMSSRVNRRPGSDVVDFSVRGYPTNFFSVEAPRGRIFRIYAEHPEEAAAIAGQAQLLSAFTFYEERNGRMFKTSYPDLTGVFMTLPGVMPYDVGVSPSKHYIDFTLPEGMKVVKLNGYDIYVIPGPARIYDWMIEKGVAIMKGEARFESGTGMYEEVVEIVRLFGSDIPLFGVPITVVETGTLEDGPKKGGPGNGSKLKPVKIAVGRRGRAPRSGGTLRRSSNGIRVLDPLRFKAWFQGAGRLLRMPLPRGAAPRTPLFRPLPAH